MKATTTAFIGLGSNLGDGIRTLKAAWEEIGRREYVWIGRLSDPYLTAPVDMESSNWFTNAVGRVETKLSVVELLHLLHDVEAEFGRTRDVSKPGYQDRSLDLDILCFGEKAMETTELVLPHPRMGDRLFVLVPFAQIAPDFRVRPKEATIGQQCSLLHEKMKEGKCPQQELKRRSWEE